jgi:lipoprotein-anchoring transpeptidase ErfK/SrfK
VDSSNDNTTSAVKGAATAALAAAAIAAPAIAGAVDTAQAASTTTDQPQLAPQPTAAAPPAPQVASTSSGASTKAYVSLSRNEAWLTDANGQTTYGPVSAAGGTSAYPTPTGTFHVLSKNAHFRSTEFHNAPMPYSVFFYPGDAFHADDVNQKSHGCIHLNWDDAEAFFNTLKVGDEVQVLP